MLIESEDQSMETRKQIIDAQARNNLAECAVVGLGAHSKWKKKHFKRQIRNDRKECPHERGKFRHHYYSISLIFMHNNYLFLLFRMDFSFGGDFLVTGKCFRRRLAAVPLISLASRDQKFFASTQKPIKLLFLSLRGRVNSDFMEIQCDRLSPKVEANRSFE